MKATSELVTAADLWRLGRDGVRRELVRGEIREMSPAGGEHGGATMVMGACLHNFVSKGRLGRVFAAETGFVIARDPDTVRAPDCAFVRGGRLPGPLPRKFVPLAPDLVVETVSADDRAREVREKVEDWLAAGVRLVWVVHAGRRTVTAHRRGRRPRTLRDDGVLEGEDVLPGFRLPVQRLWV
jgi:Uma2 family endonuclease